MHTIYVCNCSPEMSPTISDDDKINFEKLVEKFNEEQKHQQMMKNCETQSQLMTNVTGQWQVAPAVIVLSYV